MNESELLRGIELQRETNGPCVLGYQKRGKNGKVVTYTMCEASGGYNLSVGLHMVFQKETEALHFKNTGVLLSELERYELRLNSAAHEHANIVSPCYQPQDYFNPGTQENISNKKLKVIPLRIDLNDRRPPADMPCFVGYKPEDNDDIYTLSEMPAGFNLAKGAHMIFKTASEAVAVLKENVLVTEPEMLAASLGTSEGFEEVLGNFKIEKTYLNITTGDDIASNQLQPFGIIVRTDLAY